MNQLHKWKKKEQKLIPWIHLLFLYLKKKKKKKNVKLVTLVESDSKDPFSIATTPKCREGHNSFPGLLPFTLDAYLIMLSVKQGSIKYHFFESLVWLSLGLNPGLLDHWRTLYSLYSYFILDGECMWQFAIWTWVLIPYYCDIEKDRIFWFHWASTDNFFVPGNPLLLYTLH